MITLGVVLIDREHKFAQVSWGLLGEITPGQIDRLVAILNSPPCIDNGTVALSGTGACYVTFAGVSVKIISQPHVVQ